MGEAWFKPKTHGYGAQPLSWKGWAAVLGFMLVATLLALVLLVVPAVRGEGPTVLQLAVWAIAEGAATLGFVRLCRARTDGEWRWRWGERD